MITQTFGETLFLPETECFKEFPCPGSLKRQVMISTKPPQEYRKAKVAKDDEPHRSGKDSGDEEAWGKEVPILKHSFGTEKVCKVNCHSWFCTSKICW